MVPVEWAVAVDRYLAGAELGEASRRVYRIGLTTWAWLLVGRVPPTGAERRGAVAPVVPLAVLDGPGAAERLAAAFAARSAAVGARTANRELSILRSALEWWRGRGWLGDEPPATPRPEPVAPRGARLSEAQVRAVLALRVPLEDKVLWHLVHESGAAIERILALDVDRLDLEHRVARDRAADAPPLRWRGGAARLLPLLVAGRTDGPLLLTARRARPATPAGDRCRLTGRARLSYRRAAERFTAATRPLDPDGRGWTLRDLQRP